MATDLTGNKIKDTYQQILHVDGGVTSTDKIVYDGDGTATALKVSTTSVDVSSLKLNGSAITVTATQINAGVDAQPAAEAAALEAANSASAASASASSAATSYDQFDDRYLGSKSSAPTVDNDGNALLVGALYFNSVTTNMNVWNGSAWTATYIPVTGYAPLANPAFTGQITENAYNVVSQSDIGTAPNEIPLNQYLGSLAYQDDSSVTIQGGVATLDVATITAIQNDTAISNVQPTLNLDFANTKKLDSRITYARASEARYYDGKTVSKAEENLLKYSQEFDNVAWTKQAVSVTANTVLAPDGTTTADTIINNDTTTYIGQTGVGSVIPNTFSVYVKYIDNQWIGLNYGAGASTMVWFDILNGVVGTEAAGYIGSIVSVAGGWYRISIYGTNVYSSAFLWVVDADNVITATVSKSVYLWGAQLEQRSAVSSYTPTTTQPITLYQPTLLSASANVARFDHDPVTNESLGLLIEEQRTNLALYSEEFDNVAWTKSNATVTADTIVAPDGTLTGDLLSAVSSGRSYILSSANTASNTVLSGSIFVKAGNQNNVCLTTSIGNVGVRQWFNLATATSGSTISLLGGTKTSSEITSIGNDWYRLSLSMTASAGVTQYLILDVVTSDNVLSGNAGDNVYIWGAQLEAGAFPTSYIPTVASQVTRSADSAVITGSNFSSWYRTDEGTVYVDYKWLGGTAGNYALTIGSSSSNLIYLFGGGSRQATVVTNNVTEANITAGVFTSDFNAVSLGLERNNFACSLKGSTVATDTSGLVPIADKMQFGNGAYGGNFPSNVVFRKLSYFPARLSNEELQEMTL